MIEQDERISAAIFFRGSDGEVSWNLCGVHTRSISRSRGGLAFRECKIKARAAIHPRSDKRMNERAAASALSRFFLSSFALFSSGVPVIFACTMCDRAGRHCFKIINASHNRPSSRVDGQKTRPVLVGCRLMQSRACARYVPDFSLSFFRALCHFVYLSTCLLVSLALSSNVPLFFSSLLF